MHTAIPLPVPCKRAPWNKGRVIGQKRPLKPKDVWAIRVRLQLQGRKRDLALFNLAIDSKLRSCDLVKLRVRDVCHGSVVATRAIVMQQKTQRPVQFEINITASRAVKPGKRERSGAAATGQHRSVDRSERPPESGHSRFTAGWVWRITGPTFNLFER